MLLIGKDNFTLQKEELRLCRGITKTFGTSYFWATLLFSRSVRHATFALYAFFRIPDELVDNAVSAEGARVQLADWRQLWKRALREQKSDHLVLHACARVFRTYQIPVTHAEAFLNAMEQDMTVSTYETYADLQEYMYGSAAVVGLMMTEVIGYSDKRALLHAAQLGEAMQLTNFLRDIGEDWCLRRRIYLPQEDLRQFGVTAEHIEKECVDEAFKELMRFEIARARSLYTEAEQGIPFLSPKGRRAVKVALVFYRAILDEIEKQEYDVFKKRARTSSFRKISLLFKQV